MLSLPLNVPKSMTVISEIKMYYYKKCCYCVCLFAKSKSRHPDLFITNDLFFNCEKDTITRTLLRTLHCKKTNKQMKKKSLLYCWT